VGTQLRAQGLAHQLTAEVEVLLRERKHEVLMFLRVRLHHRLKQLAVTWWPEWQEFWSGRSNSLEREGNLSPEAAAEQAFQELLAKVVAESNLLYVPFTSPTADILGL